MSLLSNMFRDQPRLQACLTSDPAHLIEGTVGPFVGRVQTALFMLDGLKVDEDEERQNRYGSSTAKAVLAYKTRRQIINFSYQSTPDNIVGKMTIAALDRDLLEKQGQTRPNQSCFCGGDPRHQGAPSLERASARSLGPVSAPADATGGGSGPSPAAVAITRAPFARTLVNRARGRVAVMISQLKQPKIPVSPGILIDFDALWRNFGEPRFPRNSPLSPGQTNGAVKNLNDYLQVVDGVLAGMDQNLANAAALFRDPPRAQFPSAHAFTLGDVRKSGEPSAAEFANGIYFNPRYSSNGTVLVGPPNLVGPNRQAEVALHECGHQVNNVDITDIATETLSSAHGYSNFVLFCNFGREALGDSE